MPMRRRIALMSVARAVRSTPSKVIAPALGSSRRLQQRSSVLLPEPDGPMMNTSSWGATFRSMPRSTSVAPKLLRSARRCRIGSGTELIALRLVLGRIVAGHAGHAVAREDRDRRGAGRRLHAEPLLMHRRDRAVELHALDRVLERLAQLGRILAQRRGPDQAGRVQVGQLE